MKKVIKILQKIIGTVLSKTALIVLYLFVVLPIGIIMKLSFRDRLNLKKRNVKTYWKNAQKDESDYEQQF